MIKQVTLKQKLFGTAWHIFLGTILIFLSIWLINGFLISCQVLTVGTSRVHLTMDSSLSLEQQNIKLTKQPYDYVLVDKNSQKFIGRYTKTNLVIFKEVLKNKESLQYGSNDYFYQESKDKAIVIRINSIPEFKNHLLRHIPYNILTYIILITAILILIVFQLMKLIRLLIKNFQTLDHISNAMGKQENLQAQESSIKEFSGIIHHLVDKSEELYLLIQKEKEDKQDLTYQISALSHDVRTPLTVLKGNLELLELTDLNQIQTEYLMSMVSSIKKFEDYFSAILDYSKLLYGNLNFKMITLNALLGNLENDMPILIGEKKVKFETLYSITNADIYVDELSLYRSLMNILTNAIEHLPSEKPKLRLVVKDEEDEIHFTVWNNGPAFNEEDLKNMAKLFYTSDKNRSSKHHGLGLTFAAKTAQQHHGNLEFKNPKEGGAGVTLIIKRN